MATSAWLTSAQGQQRSDPPPQHTTTTVPDLTRVPQFRFTVVHGGGSSHQITTEAATWDDANAILSGTLTLQDVILSPDRVTPHNGDVIFCDVNEGAGFGELWRMRVYQPQLTISSETRTFSLINDLDLLRRSEESFLYRPDKRHPHGWTGPQIITDVCQRFRVPIGALYKGRRRYHFQRRLPISPLEVIRWVVTQERRHAGLRLVLRYDRGRVYVVPFTRSPGLTALGAHLIDAVYKETLADQFGSAVLVKADTNDVSQTYDQKGRLRRKPEKLFAYMTSPASIRQFGYVRRVFYSPDAFGHADLVEEAATWLAAAAIPVRSLTLTHPGIPRLRRGDAIRLGIGQDSLRRQIVYVYDVQSQLNGPGDFTQQTTVIFDDPYVDTRNRKILYKLKQTIEEADKAFPKNMGAGSPLKNDQNPQQDNPFGGVDTSAGVPGLVTPPGFGG